MRFAQFLILIALVTACGGTPSASTTAVNTAAPVVVPTPTVPPTATPEPSAAIVNGAPISLAAYETEVARFEAGVISLGRDLAREGDYRARVLEALIDKAIMLQAAASAGITVSQGDVQSALDQAVAERGGAEAFEAWLAANLYSTEQFQIELRDGMMISLMQSQIAAAVPLEAEQVHARQIMVATPEEAANILAELAAGADFATLAVARSIDSSRVNGGDLGWFPARGLTVPEVAQTAFALEQNQVSDVVQSGMGFHIIQTLERGVRPLSPGALALLQRQAIEAWRADLRANAVIERFVP